MSTKKGYAPQINVVGGENDDFDDPDQYMMLVRPFANKKMPYFQMFLPFVAMILTIAALPIDEITDGDWAVDDSLVYWKQVKEIDYDCGWNTLRFTYYWTQGYKQSEEYSYSSKLCDEDEDVFDSNWCSTMHSIGRLWLGFNIVSLLLSFVSIIVVYKQGKTSLIYFVLNFFGVICYLVAVCNWIKNEKCSDIEYYSSNDAFTVTTNVGKLSLNVID